MKKLIGLTILSIGLTVWAESQAESKEPAKGFPYTFIKDTDVGVRESLPILIVREELDNARSVAELDGLCIKYARPRLVDILDFSGIVLVGLEFSDRKTDKRYWSFAEYRDQEPLYASVRTAVNLYVSVEVGSVEHFKLESWAVVYGHLMPDGKTIAVFDTEDKKAGSFPDLFDKNSDSTVVKNNCRAALDIDDLFARLNK